MRRILVALATLACALTATATAGAATIGTTTVYSGTSSNPSGYAQLYRFTAGGSGTVDRLNVYLSSGSAPVKLGLYSGSSTAAQTRRGTCSITAPQGGAWNRCSFTAYDITAGSYYWLAVVGSGGSAAYREGRVSGGPSTWIKNVGSSLPATWSNSGASQYTGGYQGSIYADQAAPPPPPPADTDGDGVPDTSDQCPGTPAGDTVDANGCTVVTPPPPPAAQCADGIDNDNDGKIDMADPGCSSSTDNDETDQAPPPSGVTYRAPDGGHDYFSQFTNASVFDTKIPIADWGAYNFSAANTQKDASVGINVHGAALAETSNGEVNLQAMQDAGIKLWPGSDSFNNSTIKGSTVNAGWALGDEADMTFGAGTGGWDGTYAYGHCTTPDHYGCGYTVVQTINGQVPKDGRLRYNEYGKGVEFSGYPGDQLQSGWESVDEAARFVNGTSAFGSYQDVLSAEVYWYTDSDANNYAQGGTYYNNGTADITDDQRMRASNYGLLVDHLRTLDALDGKRQAILGFVELGQPADHNGDTYMITPAQVKAAVWHSLIAGARGIIYFQYSFGGPCPTQTILQDTSGCYTAIQQAVHDVDARVQSLASVLNSDFADGYVTASAPLANGPKHYVTTGVTTMAKKVAGGDYYVFAGNADNQSKTATFTLNGVDSGTAEVVDENRSIPIANGKFSDQFADGTAIHIYRIHPA